MSSAALQCGSGIGTKTPLPPSVTPVSDSPTLVRKGVSRVKKVALVHKQDRKAVVKRLVRLVGRVDSGVGLADDMLQNGYGLEGVEADIDFRRDATISVGLMSGKQGLFEEEHSFDHLELGLLAY